MTVNAATLPPGTGLANTGLAGGQGAAGTGAGNVGEQALNAAPVPLVVCNTRGVILVFNEAAATLLGIDPLTVLGRDISCLQPAPAGGLHHLLGADPDDPSFSPSRQVVPLVRGSGGTMSVELSASPVDPDGRSPGSPRLLVLSLRPADLMASLADSWTDSGRDRLGSIAENLPGIIFQRVLQADGNVYYPFFSAGVREVLGFAPDEMRVTADGCLDCIHWADRAGYLQRMQASAHDMQGYTEELRAITRDGQVRWLSGTLKPDRTAGGDVVWDAVLIDISDRMRAELRLEMIMDHAADGVITINEEGLIETVNAAVVREFGWTSAELVGQPFNTLLASPAPAEPGQTEPPAGLSAAAFGDGAMIGRGPLELAGQRKDGSTLAIELAISEVLAEGRRLYIAIVRDITSRKATEIRLHETEERLLNIADNIQGMVFQRYLHPDGRMGFSYVSEGCLRVLGVTPEELVQDGELFLHLMDSADRATYLDALRRSAETHEPMEADVKIITRQGEERWLRSWSRPRISSEGSLVWDGVSLDVTDRKRAEEELTFLAYYDPLTGLGNRSLFNERFQRAKVFAGRIDAWVSVLSLGLDRFTIVNATLGHSLGDKVLLAVARRIQETVDIGDLLCRASGDRFLLMLTGITSEEDIEDAIQAIQLRFEEPLQVEGQELDLTLSIGAASYPRDGDSAETLVMHSEAALHRAKLQGPASFQMFTEEMGQKAQKTLTMQHRVRRALENEEFVAFFQPQVATRTGKIVGMEALVRWISPEHGLIPPIQFIEVAEEFGLIDAMCEHVLRDACRWNKRWQDLGLASIPVAVNISGRQFHNSRLLLNTVDTVLRDFDMPPNFLELELTESSAMSDPENAINVVRMLAERGISCSIDDFGTGYSSLSVLKRFPISKLKIDRSFVNEVTTDPGDAAIVCAMIAMANALNLKVVAEGVETIDHLNFLHGVGCDQIQGYLMSRPLPGDQMEKMFREAPPMPTPTF